MLLRSQKHLILLRGLHHTAMLGEQQWTWVESSTLLRCIEVVTAHNALYTKKLRRTPSAGAIVP